MDELQKLLDAGYAVEFEKDGADYLAHVSEADAVTLHTGIADTPAAALVAAAEGMRACVAETAMGGDR